MENLRKLSAVEVSRLITKGEIKVIDALDSVFQRIEESEKEYHCYITLTKEQAYERAEVLQKQMDAGEMNGPLAGVPFAVKDNLCTRGIPTTCGSGMLVDFVPGYTCEAVRCLEQAGAILIGKTNMDEFAMGSTTQTSYFGGTKNPINPEHVPGGSSGGSAAAVAAEECFFALGTDTGGSVRQPAAFCGQVGLKPTYGTVSRYGLVAYASSMDQIGTFTKNVTDAAYVLEAIASRDPKDATSIKRNDTDFTAALVNDVWGMRIGIPKAYMQEGLEGDIREAVLAAASVLEQNGAVVEWFDLPMTEYAVPTYYTIACAEASSNLERFDGVKYGYRAREDKLHDMYRASRTMGFGTEVKRRIMLGSFVLSSGLYEEYYLKALKVKRLMKQAWKDAFSRYDVILGPVTPAGAPKLSDSLKDPMQLYLSDVYTVTANLLGLPAMSVPCGVDKCGLPIGLHMVADLFQEKKLLRVSYTFCNQERSLS